MDSTQQHSTVFQDTPHECAVKCPYVGKPSSDPYDECSVFVNVVYVKVKIQECSEPYSKVTNLMLIGDVSII